MKKQIFKLRNMMLLAMASLLGLNIACDEKDNDDEIRPMYGCPRSQYEQKQAVETIDINIAAPTDMEAEE